MRVTNMSLYSNDVEFINFSLIKADPVAQYVVRNITGLDAEAIVHKFYGFSAKTISKYYDFRLLPRDIVMKIALNPHFRLDETYSDIRDKLYRAISSARTGLVTIYFNAIGTSVAQITGFISKFEVSHFEAVPEVTMTIHCDDPVFRSINPVIYKNEDVTRMVRALDPNPIIIADSDSTAPHGFALQVTFSAATPQFTVQDTYTNPEWRFQVIPSGGFLTGDILYFSSEFNDKYLYIIRGGVTTHLMDRIQPGSIWPVIFPGANEFQFMELANFTWNELKFLSAYWGV